MRTSESHPLQIHGFALGSGWVGMTLCPGRKGPSLYGADWNRDLALDVGMVRDWGTTLVISLTESEEMNRLGVGDLGSAVREAGMEWLHLPIPDTGVPAQGWIDDWNQSSERIHQLLDDGQRVVIHCMGGRERTALVAMLLQSEYGVDIESGLDMVASTRPGAGPLPNQRRWLEETLAGADGHAMPTRV